MTLFESGLIYLTQKGHSPLEVRRGMTILTHKGLVAGKVAVVVVDNQGQLVPATGATALLAWLVAHKPQSVRPL